jgi:hypothetical protein
MSSFLISCHGFIILTVEDWRLSTLSIKLKSVPHRERSPPLRLLQRPFC